MTRNDAIANLKMIMIAYVEPPKTAEQIKLINDTFDMAIEALEQEPCEDAISRQAVLKPYQTLKDNDTICIWLLRKNIEQQPPVTPKHKPCISRQTIKDIDRAFKALEERDELLDKIKAEILDEAEYAYADFDRYKEDVLHAEPDELPDDDFRYGMERAVEIINKYVNESEDK